MNANHKYDQDGDPIWHNGEDEDVKIQQLFSEVREKIRNSLTPFVTVRNKEAKLTYLIKMT